MIKAFFMDVDGTLTDGGIYIGNDGEIMKRFNAKDGYGITNILPKYGIVPVIITGRKSKIVEHRCQELGINCLIQGSIDKKSDMLVVMRKLGLNQRDIAYIGDDMNDLECMQLAAIKGCPYDAVDEIRQMSDFVAEHKGGDGAVRDFIEWIVQDNR